MAMRRRTFIAALGGAAVWPLVVRGQQPATPVIGFLNSGAAEQYVDVVAAVLQGLRDTGYVEDRNVAIKYRWASGQYDRLPALAADLADHPVSVLIALGSAAAVAAQGLASAIPIVFAMGGDPVRLGLVAALNRPGTNMTGVISLATALNEKRLELVRELVPTATNVAILVNPENPLVQTGVGDLQAAAGAIGQKIQVVNAASASDLAPAFAGLAQKQTDALLLIDDQFFFSVRDQLLRLAAQHRLPMISAWRVFVAAGGLISYGTNYTALYRQVGLYAGRILKGEKPADLPVVQVTNIELVINLKTANALGLTVPPQLLARADEVIE
jgi:putative tryptophan/tyrosine transport system substrate-binding protein